MLFLGSTKSTSKKVKTYYLDNKNDLALASMLNMSLANMVNKHDEAKKFAEKILESVNITGYKAAACLELGHAQRLQGINVT